MKLRSVLPLLALALTACEEPTDVESAQSLDLASTPSIVGVWRMVEREIQGGSNPRIESGSQIQPSLLIYTEGYFMWALVLGTEPRPVPDLTSNRLETAATNSAGVTTILRYTRVE